MQWVTSAPLVSLQAELLTGSSVTGVEEAHEAGQELLKRGCGSVIITLGPQGCVVLKAQEPASTKHVQTAAVTTVDTTVSMMHIQYIIFKKKKVYIYIEKYHTTYSIYSEIIYIKK